MNRAHTKVVIAGLLLFSCVQIIGLDKVTYQAPKLEAGVEPIFSDDRCIAPGGGPAHIYIPSKNNIPAFCIHATEVTVGQYRDFVKSEPALNAGPNCGFNTDANAPASDEEPELPVTNVDWCDANAFCSWIGGTLCGKADGSLSAFVGGASENAWLLACSAHGTKKYPYGNAFSTTACNLGTVLAPVRVSDQCVGGYPTLYDMGGNADEWLGSCDTQGATTQCTTTIQLGIGSPGTPATGRVCTEGYNGAEAITKKSPNLGFRCCSVPRP
jgi:formylglycine-generating enzyme